jgi:hypothetical protein
VVEVEDLIQVQLVEVVVEEQVDIVLLFQVVQKYLHVEVFQ